MQTLEMRKQTEMRNSDFTHLITDDNTDNLNGNLVLFASKMYIRDLNAPTENLP